MLNRSKRRVIIILCIVCTAIAVVFVKTSGIKTIELSLSSLDQGINTNALIILDEELLFLDNTNDTEYLVEEGTKVSINTVIGNTNSLIYRNQDTFNLEIIEWKIKNGMYQDTHLFNKDLEKIEKELEEIDGKMLANIESKEMEQLNNKKNELIHKKRMIEGSFRYAFSDIETLNNFKQEIKKSEGLIQGQLTLKKLGIIKPSTIFFKKDGLENILHKDLLGSITPDYYDDIKNYISTRDEVLGLSDVPVLKCIDESNMYFIVKVSIQSFEDETKAFKEVFSSINQQNSIKEYDSIFSFIENRKDILMLFPKIKAEWEGYLIDGFIIDINEDNNDKEKVLSIKIDTNNHNLLGNREIDIFLHDNRYYGYIIPTEAVIKRNSIDGIIMLGKANEELFVEVKIKQELNDHIVLSPDENPEIKPGCKILAKP